MPDSSSDHDPRRRRSDNLEGLRNLERRNRSGRARRDAASESPAPQDPPRRQRLDAARAAAEAAEPARRRRPLPRQAGGQQAAAAATPGRLRFRRRWPRRILVGINLVVATCLLGAVGAYGYVHYQLGQIHKVDVAGLHGSSGPFTLLIVGSDTRDLTGSGNAAYGSAAETPGQRSDTIMLARIVPADHTLTILSIPRDLFVDIKGIGQSRINAAFNNGPDLLVSTIEGDLGIPINHYVEVNFDTFKDITDAVGGVKFYFPTPVMDVYSNLSVPTAGCVNLTGDQALAFARSRHYQYEVDGQWITQGLSDLARIQRQQAFVKKMIAKAETKFTNPLALNRIIHGITKNLTVDKGFSTGTMVDLAEDFRHADVAGLPTETLPTYNETVDGAEVLGLDQPQAGQMIARFNALGTTTSSTTTSTTSPTTVPHSHLAVQVANGSGVNGQAAAVAAALRKLGYAATFTTSTPGYDFTATEIRYAPGDKADAEQLSRQIAGGVSLSESSALTSTRYHLQVITGSDYTGVAGATSSSSSGSTATTVPTTTTTTYLLPGPTPTPAELAAC